MNTPTEYRFPFGQSLKRLTQTDRAPKKIFVLGVYASAVHAKWIRDGSVVCRALAVASEPYIFWDGNESEARNIIGRIGIPEELGCLVPADGCFNGPSARVLCDDILSPLGFRRDEAWLCDLLPEARLNPAQMKAVRERYDPLAEEYSLCKVTVPQRPRIFCDGERAGQITDELEESGADTLVLLGDIPIAQYLCRISDADFHSLREHAEKYGYGNATPVRVRQRTLNVIPLAHPRQVGGLGTHSDGWHTIHREWIKRMSSF